MFWSEAINLSSMVTATEFGGKSFMHSIGKGLF
jgi:hypothetical protein